MKPRKHWTMSWIVYTPGKGHALTEYRDGRAIWIAGEYVAKEAK